MLPFTRAVPKELLPVYDKTVIDWTMLELVACGITNIILVSSERKAALTEHFHVADFLQQRVQGSLESKLYAEVNIQTIYQQEPLGLGHAVFQAKDMVKDQDFVVVLPDEIMLPFASAQYRFRYDLAQMIDAYNQTGALQISVLAIPMDETHKYGIVKVAADGISIVDMVEKPKLENTPSNLAVVGRYICNQSVMDALANIAPGSNNEIQLTDALRDICHSNPIHIHKLQGDRTDVGSKSGWLAAQKKFADYFHKHKCSSESFLNCAS